MSGPGKVSTPRGEIVQVQFKNGNSRAELRWNTNMTSRINGAFSAAQKALDSEIVRGCDPYVPLQTGMLKLSGQLGTVFGTGEVRWVAPYAKPVYYRNKTGSNGEPKRGGYWFERWKNASGAATVKMIKDKFDL